MHMCFLHVCVGGLCKKDMKVSGPVDDQDGIQVWGSVRSWGHELLMLPTRTPEGDRWGAVSQLTTIAEQQYFGLRKMEKVKQM